MASFAAGVSLLGGATASSAGAGAAALVAVAGDGLTAGDGETSGDGDGEEGFGLGDKRCAKAPARELTDSSKLGQQLPVQLPSLSWKLGYAATLCYNVMHSGRLKAQLRCELLLVVSCDVLLALQSSPTASYATLIGLSRRR
jgi:hypothetical protein